MWVPLQIRSPTPSRHRNTPVVGNLVQVKLIASAYWEDFWEGQARGDRWRRKRQQSPLDDVLDSRCLNLAYG
jgi:hypothetical protein